MKEFVPYKRWKLKDVTQETALVDLVRNDIVPHYRKLDGDSGIILCWRHQPSSLVDDGMTE